MTDPPNMNSPKEEPELNLANRWYDQDPVLQRALEQLRQATDKQQAQVALNIIKIVVEHQMEEDTDISTEALNQTLATQASWDEHRQHRRWYDLHEALSSAIQLLCDCPEDLQTRLIPSIAQMIETTLQTEC
ncbi:hypothetical protein [Vampirovibrio sp.]|uniref:hypothetical protein n=1 Tax=Vampirovibrio sp. TaxID=2717857 RepID=UPI0035945D09